jgi:hypothetical protein
MTPMGNLKGRAVLRPGFSLIVDAGSGGRGKPDPAHMGRFVGYCGSFPAAQAARI